MIIRINDTIKITVTSILVRLHIKTGNAVVHVTDTSSPAQTSPERFSIQLPIKGMEVLSCIPQQTPGSEQDLHTSPTLLNHHVQAQVVPANVGYVWSAVHGGVHCPDE